MRKVALYGTLAAGLATLAHVLHGTSHVEHEVPLAGWQWAYVIFVIFLAPVVAAVLLWSARLQVVGTWMFLASMAGALIFGLAFHFLVPGPDNVFSSHAGAGREAFRFSAALVALTEALGCAVGVWALSKLPRSARGAAGTVDARRSSETEVG